MLADLHTTRERLRAGATTANDELAAALAVANSDACRETFLKLHEQQARQAAGSAANRDRPLAGLAVSIKDLFDLEGDSTRAAAAVLADAPPAAQDCVAVTRLKSAGA